MTGITYKFDLPNLDTNEFSLFDRIPDGSLTLDELENNGNLEELISRLVKTESVSISSYYIGRLSLALKFKIYDCLNEIVNSQDLITKFGLQSNDIVRIKNWLKHDFDLEYVAIDTSVDANISKSKSTTQIGFADTDGNMWLGDEKYSSSTYYAQPQISARFANRFFENWLFKTTLSSDYKPNILSQKDVLTYTLPDGTKYKDPGSGTNEDVTKMLGGKISSSISRIDDSASAYAGVWLGHKFDPLPENYAGGWSIWAGGEVSKLFGTPLSLDLSLDYSDDDYAPAEIENRQTADGRSLTAEGSLSDQLSGNFGLSADYSLTKSNNISDYSSSDNINHDFSGVGQFTLANNHVVKTTLTGSLATSSSSRTDRPETTESETASAKVKISDDWKTSSDLQLSASVSGKLNSSKGSWNGLYPSFTQALSFGWTPGNWNWQTSLSGSQNTWTLDYTPIEEGDLTTEGTYSASYIYGSLWSQLTFEPLDWLKMSVSGDFGKNAAWGYHPSDDFDYSCSGYISARLFADPGALWITLDGEKSYQATFDQFDPGTDYTGNSYSVSLSASFSDLRF